MESPVTKKLSSLLPPLESYPSHSRVHRLASFDTDKATVYVKREDELGFAASGSKLRKYLSLVPYLESKMPLEVAVVGNPFSNHVLSLSVLLKEKKIPYTVFLEGEPPEVQGNYFFLSLVTDLSKVVWVPSGSHWETVIQEHEKILGKHLFLVPVGGSMRESFPGALTLALDVLRNEEELKMSFDHVLVDSGTGMMAASLVLGLSYLHKNTKIHVVQLGGKEEDFSQQLRMCYGYLQDLTKEKSPLPSDFTLARPGKGRSFGSVTSEHIQFIKEIARTEGIFLDPLYNAKLFHEGKRMLEENLLEGNVLIIHSGGNLTLCGFQKKIF